MNTKQLVATLTLVLLTMTAMAQAQGGPPRGGRGFGPAGRGGRGGPPGPQNQPGPGGAERLLDDLALVNLQQGLDARAALVAYDESIRQQTLQARRVLLDKMRTILNDDQFSRFSEDLNQVPLLPPVPPPGRAVATTDLVDRVMGFDQNHDGKIARDELPERMLNLFDEGDANHDGTLDRQELTNLANRNSVNDRPGPRGGGGRRGGGR